MALSEVEQARQRMAAFDELELLLDSGRGFFTRDELTGFMLEGRRFPLVDRNRGIRNPADFDASLSIVSATDGPYNDHTGDDGLLRYAFQAGDPYGGDNRKLRAAMQQQTPIILFEKPMSNLYVPIFPAFVVGEDLESRHFIIAADPAVRHAYRDGSINELDRRYVERVVRQRVHQPVFRARVLTAYDRMCAICRLRHVELLDAAHIVPDAHELGLPHVSNGLSLCKIHHAAYDSNLLGVSADYTVHLDRHLLDEVDGPMLRHGLQDMHGVKLVVPRRREFQPSREALSERFASFGR